METLKHPYVFQTDSDLIKEAFQKDNFLIEVDNSSSANKDLCAIYFSSNDIYFPNEPDVFEKNIISKNKFEWYGTRINNCSKHIFLRDIQKQWYLEGINYKFNSLEKVFEFLQKETEGFRVVTVGSSAGGYAAVLFGQKLKAEKIMTFNGQFMLKDRFEESSELRDPIVYRQKENPLINRYFDLLPHIFKPNNIYYFYSSMSKWDITQYSHIRNSEIQFIGFKTSHHGIPFLKAALSKVLNLSNSELRKLTSRKHSSFWFTISMIGLSKTIINFYFQVYAKKKRRKG